MVSRFERCTSWIVNLPWLTALVILGLSGLALLGYCDPDFFQRHLGKPPYDETARRSTDSIPGGRVPASDALSITRSDAILVVESDQIFTPRGAAALRHIVARIESQEHVRNVLWMDRVPILNIFGLPEPLFPRAGSSAQQFAAAKEKALAHPLVGGQLVAADGKTLLIMIAFDWLFVQTDEDCMARLKQVAERAAADYADVSFRFGVTGRVPLTLTAMQQHERNQLRYQLIGYGMIAVMAVVLFRGISAVIVVALAPALGVFWALGMIRFMGWEDNPFNDVVLPVLISLVGLTDGVHLMVHLRRLRVAGHSEKEAARRAIADVGLACALTSLTTAIGFGSLSLAHHATVREFGWSCVVGVIVTFAAVVTVIPLASSTRIGRRIHVGHEHGLIDQRLGQVSGLIDWVLSQSRLLSCLAVFTTLICVLISAGLRPDERNADALPENCDAVIALNTMDRAFGGLEIGKIELWWSDQVKRDSAEILQVVTRVDRLLKDEALIGHPLSMRNFIDALPGDGPKAERMSLLELLPPQLKHAFYSADERAAVVTFRVQDLGIARYGPVFERIQAGLNQIQHDHPQFRFDMTGSAIWRWENLYQIVVDLAASLGSALVIIWVVLTLAYRSVRIGLISLVPNLFPLAVTGAYLRMTGQALELVNVCAFTICLGIAVDDSIHFLTRYQEERKRTDNDAIAIRRAFAGVGKALITTTIMLIAGFSTVIFSGLRDHRIFAKMGGLTIASALFADLVFLPALLACFAPQRARPPQRAESPASSSTSKP